MATKEKKKINSPTKLAIIAAVAIAANGCTGLKLTEGPGASGKLGRTQMDLLDLHLSPYEHSCPSLDEAPSLLQFQFQLRK